MIIWNGISNEDVGIVIEHYPRVIIPKRRLEVQSIPGGIDFVIDQGSFENYEQQYSAFIDAKELGGLEAVIPRVSEWLLSSGGYKKLEDSYFPDVYRMAYLANAIEFSNTFSEYGRGILSFNCAPQKWYKHGQYEITLTSGQKLYNPSLFQAEPLFKVIGSGAGVLTVDSKSLTISEVGTSVDIDIRTHKAYSGTTNRASTITGNYEDLKLGKESTISWSGGITGVTIIPRWWTI